MKTVKISPDQMARRVARFDRLEPMQQQNPAAIPPDALKAITAPRLCPVMAPKEEFGPWAKRPPRRRHRPAPPWRGRPPPRWPRRSPPPPSGW